MLNLHSILKDNRFNVTYKIVNTYTEFDMEGEYTVVVLENENGQSIGVAEGLVNKNYTVIKPGKETKQQIIKRLADSYRNVGNIEDLDNDLYELSLLEEMDFYGVTDQVFEYLAQY